jgi:tryptophanyl-tRNA synthetase
MNMYFQDFKMTENNKPDLEKIAKEQHAIKLAQKEKESNYYPEKLEEFGLKTINRFVDFHPDPSKYMKLGITFGHKGMEPVAEAMANNEPWAVVSGLNPSGPLHMGHKAVFDELLWMQKNGADVFIPITNDESYVVGKTSSLAESRRIAIEQVIPSIIAMGFKAEKTKIFIDSDYMDIYNVAMDLSPHLTLNKAFGVFGFDKSEQGENPGTMFYRSGVQLAQILLPQYEEFGGPKPTLIPVGIDQHPYIQLSREVARKKGFIPPAELDLKFMWGLDGKGKMSASREESAIFLTDSPEVAKKKLKKSYTGGNPVADYQRQHGGIPEICPIYTLRTYHFESDNNVGESCSSGEILCGNCKNEAVEQTLDYLSDHQAKLPEARKRINEYILTTPIRSIFK